MLSFGRYNSNSRNLPEKNETLQKRIAMHEERAKMGAMILAKPRGQRSRRRLRPKFGSDGNKSRAA